MDTQAKALELFEDMFEAIFPSYNAEELAKDCAKIAVDEIIKGIERAFDEYEKHTGVYVKNKIFYYDFYEDVKHKIKKL